MTFLLITTRVNYWFEMDDVTIGEAWEHANSGQPIECKRYGFPASPSGGATTAIVNPAEIISVQRTDDD